MPTITSGKKWIPKIPSELNNIFATYEQQNVVFLYGILSEKIFKVSTNYTN